MDLFSFVYELYDVLTCAPGDTPQDTASTNVKAPLPPPPAKTVVSTTPVAPTTATTPAIANVTSAKAPVTKAIAKK
jgi:hypothetical protein